MGVTFISSTVNNLYFLSFFLSFYLSPHMPVQPFVFRSSRLGLKRRRQPNNEIQTCTEHAIWKLSARPWQKTILAFHHRAWQSRHRREATQDTAMQRRPSWRTLGRTPRFCQTWGEKVARRKIFENQSQSENTWGEIYIFKGFDWNDANYIISQVHRDRIHLINHILHKLYYETRLPFIRANRYNYCIVSTWFY